MPVNTNFVKYQWRDITIMIRRCWMRDPSSWPCPPHRLQTVPTTCPLGRVAVEGHTPSWRAIGSGGLSFLWSDKIEGPVVKHWLFLVPAWVRWQIPCSILHKSSLRFRGLRNNFGVYYWRGPNGEQLAHSISTLIYHDGATAVAYREKMLLCTNHPMKIQVNLNSSLASVLWGYLMHTKRMENPSLYSVKHYLYCPVLPTASSAISSFGRSPDKY